MPKKYLNVRLKMATAVELKKYHKRLKKESPVHSDLSLTKTIDLLLNGAMLQHDLFQKSKDELIARDK